MTKRIEIEAQYRALTPLFCAGGDPKSAELRLPSFKGVLRFWWRALAWSRCAGDLVAIQKEENDLFGSVAGQARVAMRLLLPDPAPQVVNIGSVLSVPEANQTVVGDGARYLGYGVMEAFGRRGGQLTRACLRSPCDFTVRMRGRNLNDAERRALLGALTVLGTLGSMGAKSRKGYGSLALQSLRVDGDERWTPPQSAGELANRITELLPDDALSKLPEYTAFSGEARYVLLTGKSGEDPMELLDRIGREMVRFRSWGHRGKILGHRESERNFKDDHDLMKDKSVAERDHHPRRIAFGLPHNYGSGRSNQVGPRDRWLERRASPLFIHIHQCGDTPVGVVSFLPARFLPRGKSDISVGGQTVPQVPEAELYQPIHDFLDRLLDPGRRRETFSAAVELKR